MIHSLAMWAASFDMAPSSAVHACQWFVSSNFQFVPKVWVWPGGGAVTVKLIWKVAGILFAPLTITVSLYVPGARPVLGATVNMALPPMAMSAMVAVESVKLPLYMPESSTASGPVARLPSFVTATASGVCAP